MSDRVDVVIPTFNQSAMTEACAASLARHTPAGALRILWVDNASGAEDYARAAAAWAATGFAVVPVRLPANLGFIKATNAGLALATAPLILFLNNDTEVPAGWLAALRAVLDAEPTVGIVGPRSSSPLERQGTLAAGPGYVLQGGDATIAFFCALMRREVLERVGQLDESFGVGLGDDDDYCRRARAAGFALAVRTDLVVVHHARTTFTAVYGEAGWKAIQRANRAKLDAGQPVKRTLAALATLNHRPGLAEALASLRPQVTRLHIVCNGMSTPPACVRDLADEWLCDPTNACGATAKLHWSDQFHGLYLACDDDVVYPPDYAAVTRRWVERWRGKAIVTYHARLFRGRAATFQESREAGGLFKVVPYGVWVNYPGGNAIGWDARLHVPPRFTESAVSGARDGGREFMGNEEAHIAVWAQHQGVPIFLAPHAADWFRDLNGPTAPQLWKVDKADRYRRLNAIIGPQGRGQGWQVYRAA